MIVQEEFDHQRNCEQKIAIQTEQENDRLFYDDFAAIPISDLVMCDPESPSKNGNLSIISSYI